MVINQNVVVWNQKHQKHKGRISLCSEFRYHSENFAIIAKKPGIAKLKFSLCTVIFAMIAKFHYDSEISL